MKDIFEQGYFNQFSSIDLTEARSSVLQHSGYAYYAQEPTTVFISHKHSDLQDLKVLLGFLEEKYNVKVYIDSKVRQCQRKHRMKPR